MLFQADDRVPKITEPKFGAMTAGVKSVSRYELRKCTSDSGTGASSLGNEFLYISLVPQKLSDRFLFLNFQISNFCKKIPRRFFTRKKNFRSTSHLHAIFSPRLKQGPFWFLVRFLYFFLRARAPCFIRVILRPEKKRSFFTPAYSASVFSSYFSQFFSIRQVWPISVAFRRSFFLGLFLFQIFFFERERAGGHSVSLELPLTPKAESEQKRRTRLRCFWLD